jgi:hypothetical protein
MPVNAAYIEYMTKVGVGYIIDAPGLASAMVTICRSSSDPLPSITLIPAGTFIRLAISARSFSPSDPDSG